MTPQASATTMDALAAFRDFAVFGFLKRRRVKSIPPRAPVTRPGPADSQTPPDEQNGGSAGRNWYGSSRDLHDGLYVNEDATDVTVPAPLDEHDEKKAH
jgi:hypothetical protein